MACVFLPLSPVMELSIATMAARMTYSVVSSAYYNIFLPTEGRLGNGKYRTTEHVVPFCLVHLRACRLFSCEQINDDADDDDDDDDDTYWSSWG